MLIKWTIMSFLSSEFSVCRCSKSVFEFHFLQKHDKSVVNSWEHEVGHELGEIVRLSTKSWDLASLNLEHIPKSLLIHSIIFVSNIKMEGSSCWYSQISKSISIITWLSWRTCPCQLIILISVKRLLSRWWMIAEQVNVIGL